MKLGIECMPLQVEGRPAANAGPDKMTAVIGRVSPKTECERLKLRLHMVNMLLTIKHGGKEQI